MRKLENEKGFSLLELIIVVTMIGLLAAWGLKYYNEDINDARRISIKTLSYNFNTAVAGVHAQWLLQSDKSQPVDLDGTLIAVNRYGWPKGVAAGAVQSGGSSYPGSVQQRHCAELWMNLLQNPAPYVLAGDPEDQGVRYRVSIAQPGVCRFGVTTRQGKHYYFDYYSRNGQVISASS